jgi:hypothetical protein
LGGLISGLDGIAKLLHFLSVLARTEALENIWKRRRFPLRVGGRHSESEGTLARDQGFGGMGRVLEGLVF